MKIKSILGYFRGLARPFAESGFAVLIGLLAGALIILIAGHDPLEAYRCLFEGGFGTKFNLMTTLGHMTPLLLTAATFLIGARSGMFNIGAEGQFYLGAVAAVAVGSTMYLPPGIHLVLAVGASMLAGVLWALIPAILKVWRGVSEVLSTLMFNYIAYFLTYFLIFSYLMDPILGNVTLEIKETARFPVLDYHASLSTAIFLSLGICVLFFILLQRTRVGYELRLTGSNPVAARYAGISHVRVGLLSFIIGGAAAGIAGGLQLLGRPPFYAIRTDFANILGFGWGGIIISLIGRNHPLGIIPATFFMGGLKSGAKFMQKAGVSTEMVPVIQGIILMALAVPQLLKMIRERLK